MQLLKLNCLIKYFSNVRYGHGQEYGEGDYCIQEEMKSPLGNQENRNGIINLQDEE
jgi:hypothetical protein